MRIVIPKVVSNKIAKHRQNGKMKRDEWEGIKEYKMEEERTRRSTGGKRAGERIGSFAFEVTGSKSLTSTLELKRSWKYSHLPGSIWSWSKTSVRILEARESTGERKNGQRQGSTQDLPL